MATVHLAEDLKHGRMVALKVLRPELGVEGARFLREVRVTARLQHPGIVPLYDSGNANGVLFYVMPWVQGESLRERIDREGAMSLDASLGVLRSVAAALHYAHEQGVVHRDVKPSNILLGAHDTVVVADFGVAHAVQVAGDQRLTAVGRSVGTPSYMSPEQAAGDEDVDARSDIYALGAMAFEMLSGHPPFAGTSTAALLAKKLTQAPPTLSEFPPAVQRMVDRALQTERGRRQGSARELAQTAASILTASAAGPRTATDGPPAIVVLPFRNLSPDPDNAYLADGIAEEILSDFAQLDALRVISRRTAAQYRDTPKSTPEIASELDVHYVLEGSVRKAGNAVRATVQLVEAATDKQLWSAKFSGTVDDVFEIQERVSSEVFEALHLSLSEKDLRRVASRKEEDPQTLELIMRVRYEMWQLTPESVRRAEALLDQRDDLVQRTPRLMAAKAHLLFQSVNFGLATDERRIDLARSLAEAAIAQDPDCAAAYSALAWIHAGRLRQLDRGVEYAEQALTLDPSDQDARILVVVAPRPLGVHRTLEPDEIAGQLLREDPLSPVAHAALSMGRSGRGDWAGAVEAMDRSLELEWNALFALSRAWYLCELGRTEAAVETLDRCAEEGGPMARLASALRHAIRGEPEAAVASIDDEVVEWARPDGEYSWLVAAMFAFAGARDRAIRWLDRAVDNQFFNWRMLAEHDRLLGSLHGDPDFERIVERARREQKRLVDRWTAESSHSAP